MNQQGNTIRMAMPDDIVDVRCLLRAYESYLDAGLGFQSYEEELANLPGEYAPPSGALLVGLHQGDIVGCVAHHLIEEGVCEMERLYVRPEARGAGLGRQLACETSTVARSQGYRLMRLDTLERLVEAMRLYESLGFRRIEPYYENPLEGIAYWELDLR